MNFSFSSPPPTEIVVGLGLFTLLQLILWLVIAWRAMRAHEEIATSLQSLVRHIRLRDDEQVQREIARERRGGTEGRER
jgi:hypothetical protein